MSLRNPLLFLQDYIEKFCVEYDIIDDPLVLIYFAVFQATSNNIFIVIFPLCLTVVLSSVSVFIYQCTVNFTWSYFIQNSPMFLATCFVALCIVGLMIFKDTAIVQRSMINQHLRSMREALPGALQTIQQEVAKIKLDFLLITGTIMAILMVYLPIGPQQAGSDVFTVVFIKSECGNWATFLLLVFYGGTGLAVAGAGLIPCSFVYFSTHAVFQLIILNEDIEDLANYHDQDVIYAKLVRCVDLYSNIREYCKYGMDKLYIPMVVFYYAGLGLAIDSILYLYTNLDDFSLYHKILAIGLLIVAVANITINTGQLLIDQSNLVFENLSNCLWYDWNARNKKLLIYFLMISMKPIQYSAANLFVVNREVVIKVLQVLYPFTAIGQQIANLKKN